MCFSPSYCSDKSMVPHEAAHSTWRTHARTHRKTLNTSMQPQSVRGHQPAPMGGRSRVGDVPRSWLPAPCVTPGCGSSCETGWHSSPGGPLGEGTHPETLNATKEKKKLFCLCFISAFLSALNLLESGSRQPWYSSRGRPRGATNLAVASSKNRGAFAAESSVNSCVSICPIASLSRSQADGGGEGYSRDDGVADTQFIYLFLKRAFILTAPVIMLLVCYLAAPRQPAPHAVF